MNLPQGARGRLTALGLLLIALLVIYQLTLAPLWARYTELRPAIAEQRAQLARYQQLAARAPLLRERLDALRNDPRFNDYLVPGNSSALAAAGLQQRLQELVQAHDGRVLSTRVGKPRKDGDFEQVTLNARLQIDLAGLQALLYSLETRAPYLYVRNLNVFRQAGRRQSDNDTLDVQMDIDGLRLPDATEADHG